MPLQKAQRQSWDSLTQGKRPSHLGTAQAQEYADPRNFYGSY